MNGLKWMKLSLDIFENRKIKYIMTSEYGAEYTLIWIKLLCLAGKIGDGGEIYIVKAKPYKAEMLSVALGVTLERLEEAIALFDELSMIEYLPCGTLKVKNYTAYQDNTKFGGISGMLRREEFHTDKEENKKDERREEEIRGDKIREEKNRKEKNINNSLSHAGVPAERENEFSCFEVLKTDMGAENPDSELCEVESEFLSDNTDGEETFAAISEEKSDFPKKRAYGILSNVFLSETEYGALNEKHSDILGELIDEFSLYIENKDGSFSNHFAALMRWANNEYADKLRQRKRAEKNASYGSSSVDCGNHLSREKNARKSEKNPPTRYGDFDPEEAFLLALERSAQPW